MRITQRRLSWLWVALLLSSCATAEKLAKRSELELRQGDPEKAYASAVVALDRKPGMRRALAALNAAATARAEDWKARIHRLMGSDTLAAARQALQFESFRREVALYGGTLAPDVEFAAFEHEVRLAAARILYDQADADLADHQPKQAYDDLLAAQSYSPGFRDLSRRLADVYEQAVQRVVILPVEDQSGVPDIARPLGEHIWSGVQSRLSPSELRFTRLMGPEQAYSRMTVSELDDLSRERAIRLGRRMGADRVVWSRIYSVHTETDNNRYHDIIYRKRAQRDTSGRTRDVYEPVEFEALQRNRRVTVSWEVEVLGVTEEALVSRRGSTVEAAARTVYSNFQAEGDCDDYCLVPPSIKSSDSDRADRAQRRWKDAFGSWTVPSLLQTSRQEHGRRHRFSDVRSEFRRDTRERPVFFDDLPDEGELTLLALDDLWRPVIETLKEQDAR